MNITLLGLTLVGQYQPAPVTSVSAMSSLRRLTIDRSLFRCVTSPVIQGSNIAALISRTTFSKIQAGFLASTEYISGQSFSDDYSRDFGACNVTFFGCTFLQLHVECAIKVADQAKFEITSSSAFGCVVSQCLVWGCTGLVRDFVVEEHEGPITQFSGASANADAGHEIERVTVTRSTLASESHAAISASRWAVDHLNVTTCLCKNSIIARDDADGFLACSLKYVHTLHCVMERHELSSTKVFYYLPTYSNLTIDDCAFYNLTDLSGNPSSVVVHFVPLGGAVRFNLTSTCFINCGSQSLSFYKEFPGFRMGTAIAQDVYFDSLETKFEDDVNLLEKKFDNIQYGVDKCPNLDPSQETPEPPRKYFEYGVIADIKRTFRYE